MYNKTFHLPPQCPSAITPHQVTKTWAVACVASGEWRGGVSYLPFDERWNVFVCRHLLCRERLPLLVDLEPEELSAEHTLCAQHRLLLRYEVRQRALCSTQYSLLITKHSLAWMHTIITAEIYNANWSAQDFQDYSVMLKITKVRNEGEGCKWLEEYIEN